MCIFCFFYPCQGGYNFFVVCLFVCLLAGLCKNYSTDFHKIWWRGAISATEETSRFFDGNPGHVTLGLGLGLGLLLGGVVVPAIVK